MNLIVNVDQNWAIGDKGKLLVSIPEDMKFFRSETSGKVVVLGRKTLDTFPGGQPLKNRTNIILSHNPDYKVKGAIVCHSVEEVLEELKKYNALQIAGAFGVKPNQINDYSKSSYSNSEMQQLSFYVDTELFIIKQYEEEINFKMLPDEDTDDGYYYKFNEKVLFRTDSKTQMEYLRNGVGGMIIKPNEARRKLDMEDAEGGDVLLANGSIVPLTMAGAAYLKGESEQENTDEPEQPEKETEPDTEQPDTATEPDETDTAEDETHEEGGE